MESSNDIDDPVLGRIYLSNGGSWLWQFAPSVEVELMLDCQQDEVLKELPHYRDFLRYIRDNEATLRLRAILETPILHNAWDFDDTGIELTPRQIAERLVLGAILFPNKSSEYRANMDFSLIYNDGGVFLGHLVHARFGHDGNVVSVNLEG